MVKTGIGIEIDRSPSTFV